MKVDKDLESHPDLYLGFIVFFLSNRKMLCVHDDLAAGVSLLCVCI